MIMRSTLVRSLRAGLRDPKFPQVLQRQLIKLMWRGPIPGRSSPPLAGVEVRLHTGRHLDAKTTPGQERRGESAHARWEYSCLRELGRDTEPQGPGPWGPLSGSNGPSFSLSLPHCKGRKDLVAGSADHPAPARGRSPPRAAPARPYLSRRWPQRSPKAVHSAALTGTPLHDLTG